MSNQSNDAPPVMGNMAKAEEMAAYQAELDKANEELSTLGENGDPLAVAKAKLARVIALMGLEQKEGVWEEARPLLETFLDNYCWEQAVDTCEVLYRTDQAESLAALIHGVWLAVSFPIDPELSVLMLDHLIEEIPKDADGAAVAAATAHYIVGTRANDEAFDNLNFLTTNLLARIAKSHSNVETQEQMDFWVQRLELNSPEAFLPRLAMILNTVVNEHDWWFDRDEIRTRFPQ